MARAGAQARSTMQLVTETCDSEACSCGWLLDERRLSRGGAICIWGGRGAALRWGVGGAGDHIQRWSDEAEEERVPKEVKDGSARTRQDRATAHLNHHPGCVSPALPHPHGY
jgi:hypothetical protein